MVYVDISNDGFTDLYIIRNGTLTCCRYREEILIPIVVLYAAAIKYDYMLMDDNCRSHRANFEKDFLFEEGSIRTELPGYCPDMDPIKHVWDILGRCHLLPPRIGKVLIWRSGRAYPSLSLIASLIP
ncbi:transposable element Tcb2 transposase [Trichonephila clavipes]|nr:transposable element Tcb2 transposase [Trichonephila clavipes]